MVDQTQDDGTSTSTEPSRPYRLPALDRYLSLAVLIAIFFFGGGHPVWANPFDVDLAVWLSYAPIPLVVLALLFVHRRFSYVALFLNTMELTLVKFAITYSVAIVLWATSGGPPPAAEWKPHMHPDPSAVAKPDPEPAPPATPWPDSKRASVRGRVHHADGSAVVGALVFISKGLEMMSFAPPREPLRIQANDEGFGATFLVAQEDQGIVARSSDGRLHNLVASPERDAPFNVPLLADGSWQRVTPPPAGSFLRLKCIVHAPREPESQLLVVNHPHHAVTDGEGRFDLGRVPARDVVISVQSREPDGAGPGPSPSIARALSLKANEPLVLDLVLGE
jgi:hypothetical protein